MEGVFGPGSLSPEDERTGYGFVWANGHRVPLQSKRVLEKLNFKYFDELQNIDYTGKCYLEIVMSLENNDKMCIRDRGSTV